MLDRKNELQIWFFIIYFFIILLPTTGSSSEQSLFESTFSSFDIGITNIVNDTNSNSKNSSLELQISTEAVHLVETISTEVTDVAKNADSLLNILDERERLLDYTTTRSYFSVPITTPSNNKITTDLSSEHFKTTENQDAPSIKSESWQNEEKDYSIQEIYDTSTELSNNLNKLVGQRLLNFSTTLQTRTSGPTANETVNYHDAYIALRIISSAYNPFKNSLPQTFSAPNNSYDFENSKLTTTNNVFKNSSGCLSCTMVPHSDTRGSSNITNNSSSENQTIPYFDPSVMSTSFSKNQLHNFKYHFNNIDSNVTVDNTLYQDNNRSLPGLSTFNINVESPSPLVFNSLSYDKSYKIHPIPNSTVTSTKELTILFNNTPVDLEAMNTSEQKQSNSGCETYINYGTILPQCSTLSFKHTPSSTATMPLVSPNMRQMGKDSTTVPTSEVSQSESSASDFSGFITFNRTSDSEQPFSSSSIPILDTSSYKIIWGEVSSSSPAPKHKQVYNTTSELDKGTVYESITRYNEFTPRSTISTTGSFLIDTVQESSTPTPVFKQGESLIPTHIDLLTTYKEKATVSEKDISSYGFSQAPLLDSYKNSLDFTSSTFGTNELPNFTSETNWGLFHNPKAKDDQYMFSSSISPSFETTTRDQEVTTMSTPKYKQTSSAPYTTHIGKAYQLTLIPHNYISSSTVSSQDSSLYKITWDQETSTQPKIEWSKPEEHTSINFASTVNKRIAVSDESISSSSVTTKMLPHYDNSGGKDFIPLSTSETTIPSSLDFSASSEVDYYSTTHSYHDTSDLEITIPTTTPKSQFKQTSPSTSTANDETAQETTNVDRYNSEDSTTQISSLHSTRNRQEYVTIPKFLDSSPNGLSTINDTEVYNASSGDYVSSSTIPFQGLSLNNTKNDQKSPSYWISEASPSNSITYETNDSIIHRWITVSNRLTSGSTMSTPSSFLPYKTYCKTELTENEIPPLNSAPTPVDNEVSLSYTNTPSTSVNTKSSAFTSDSESSSRHSLSSTTENLKRIFWYWRPTTNRYPPITSWKPSSTSTRKPSSTAADDAGDYVEYTSTQSTDFDSTTPSLEEGVEEVRYSVYWNVPTFQCHKYGLNFSAVSDWGIEQNFMDEFRGEAISILYDPGEFPALLPASGGSRVSRNGGVPQEGSLTRHLTLFAAHLDKLIPDHQFKGLGIIDFEHWRPVWRQNWGSLSVYRDYSRHLERRRHPFWFSTMIEMEAKFKYELAARTFILETLRMAKRLRPMAKWGYYGYPFCFNYTPYNNRASCSYETSRDNDGMSWMFNEETSHYPSLYLKENDMYTWKRRRFVEGRLDESLRVAKDIPVYPYVWYKYHDTDRFLSQADMLEVLKRPLLRGCRGVVIWGASRDVNSREKCQSLARYLDEVIGPIVLELKTGPRMDLYDETTPINEEEYEDENEDEEDEDEEN